MFRRTFVRVASLLIMGPDQEDYYSSPEWRRLSALIDNITESASEIDEEDIYEEQLDCLDEVLGPATESSVEFYSYWKGAPERIQ